MMDINHNGFNNDRSYHINKHHHEFNTIEFDMEIQQQVHAQLNQCNENQLFEWFCALLPHLLCFNFQRQVAQPCLYLLPLCCA